MFRTRLNPTKPPAAHRAVLERIGAACRQVRPIEDECWAANRANDQIEQIFDLPSLLRFGNEVEPIRDPLLLAMAAERIGREGWRLVRWFAAHVASQTHARPDDDQPEPDRTGLISADTRIDRFMHLHDPPWSPDARLARPLTESLCQAAGGLGLVADCLETLADRFAEQLGDDGKSLAGELERLVARTACDLESVRGVTYAAAELRRESDRRPDSRHLLLESGTLVYEALWLSQHAIRSMFERLRGVAGESMVAYLPMRHRAFAHAEFLGESIDRRLTAAIARYYLFE